MRGGLSRSNDTQMSRSFITRFPNEWLKGPSTRLRRDCLRHLNWSPNPDAGLVRFKDERVVCALGDDTTTFSQLALASNAALISELRTVWEYLSPAEAADVKRLVAWMNIPGVILTKKGKVSVMSTACAKLLREYQLSPEDPTMGVVGTGWMKRRNSAGDRRWCQFGHTVRSCPSANAVVLAAEVRAFFCLLLRKIARCSNLADARWLRRDTRFDDFIPAWRWENGSDSSILTMRERMPKHRFEAFVQRYRHKSLGVPTEDDFFGRSF